VDDVRDPRAWAIKFFTPDATFQNGNFPKRKGHDQIMLGAQTMYNMCTALKHNNTAVYSLNETTVLTEGDVTYTVTGGIVLEPIRKASVFELTADCSQIQHYRVCKFSS